MTFPDTPLDTSVEIKLGDTWTDITDYVYVRDGIEITRGRGDEASQAERGTARMTLDNRGGRFSPRNPLSPYFGLLGRNAPLRIGIGTGARFLLLTGASGDQVTVPDSAGVSVTGDIDIRIDMTASRWSSLDLCGKYVTTGNQRSWVFQIAENGTLVFTWSPDGTFTNAVIVQSTESIPLAPGRRAVRITLDVDNGAAGKTVTFYTADTISGTWTQLGSAVTSAGTTSVFDSTAAVEIGDVAALTGVNGASDDATLPVNGHVHAFELRNGVGGSAVANPDFSVPAAGVTSFTDAAANTWTLAGAAEITDRHWRMWGEVSSWPTSWDPSGNDVYTTIEASGILRRIEQGIPTIRSTLFRGLVTLGDTSTLMSYWPMEDGSDSQLIANAVENGFPMQFQGSPQLASSAVFACSDPLPVLGDGTFIGQVARQSSSGELQVRFLMSIPAAGTTDGAILARIWCTGAIRTWDLRYNTASGGSLTLLGYGPNATLLFTSATVSFFNGKDMRLSLEFTQVGADIDITLASDYVGINGGVGSLFTATGVTFESCTSVWLGVTKNLDDVVVGHLSVHSEITSIVDLATELDAYLGETAGRRLERICGEEGIAFTLIGDPDATETMGPQYSNTFRGILEECAATDGGILYEPRDTIGLGYRTRETLYNQDTRIALDYTAGHLAGALDPVDDDQNTRNDVTVSRLNGSSARAELAAGPMSIQAPPDGVGRYDESITINNTSDARLPDLARWRVHLGTWDEARYPSVAVNLGHPSITSDPALVTSLLDFEFGDVLTVDGVPSWLPPDQISQMIQGYTETLEPFGHRMTFNCSPAGPWRVAVYGQDRYDTAGAELAAGVDFNDTTLSVATTLGPLWTRDPLDLPMDLRVGGEVVRVVPADQVTDTFNRSVSSGWGTSDTGDAWTVTGGSASDFSVASGTGRVSMGSVSVRRFTSAGSMADVAIRADITVPATATGGSISAGLVARYTDDQNFYLLQLLHDTSGTIDLEIVKRVAGTFTTLASMSNFMAYTPGTATKTRFRVQGSTLMARIWTSTTEPEAWHVMATDSALAGPGAIGTHSNLLTGNTNSTPVITYAALDASAPGVSGTTSPQTMTVQRSINGVVKSHTAGTAISLANPVPYAL